MSAFQVTFTGAWPSGGDKPAALLNLSVAEVESLLDVEFRPGQDDLDSFLQLGLRLESGRLLLLQRHDGSPHRGVAVYIDSADDPGAAIREMKRCLDVDDATVEWTASSASSGGPLA